MVSKAPWERHGMNESTHQYALLFHSGLWLCPLPTIASSSSRAVYAAPLPLWEWASIALLLALDPPAHEALGMPPPML